MVMGGEAVSPVKGEVLVYGSSSSWPEIGSPAFDIPLSKFPGFTLVGTKDFSVPVRETRPLIVGAFRVEGVIVRSLGEGLNIFGDIRNSLNDDVRAGVATLGWKLSRVARYIGCQDG